MYCVPFCCKWCGSYMRGACFWQATRARPPPTRARSCWHVLDPRPVGPSLHPNRLPLAPPVQALANANSNFLLTERRRHYLRYLGALTFFEINGPSGWLWMCRRGARASALVCCAFNVVVALCSG
jgi:hypothetical protein